MSDTRTRSRRRRALRVAAPVAGLLAAGLLVWQGSYAAFSAQTDNGTQTWSTGSLTLTNDGGTGTYAASTTAIFNETNLKIPSSTVSRCLTVRTGGAGGTLNFYRGAISGTNSAGLAPQVSLVIRAMPTATVDPNVTTNCTNFNSGTASTIATTTLSALPTTYGTGLGSIVVPNGARFVAYQFTYQLTSTGSNAGDNALQSSSAQAQFNWEIQ
jgi:hypothetical protein